MNQFINKINKLKFIYDENNKQISRINNQESKDNKLVKDIVINQPQLNFFNKINDFSTNWVAFIRTSSGGSLYKNYIIEWEKFDERLLPFLKIDVMFRINSGNSTQEYIPNPYISKFFVVSPIANETDYKKVKLIATVHFVESNDLDYEGKLNITFVNPREYR
jgi:hypothetical protein